MASFLEGHYFAYRLAGGDPAPYAAQNDLEPETAERLEAAFRKAHPGKPSAKKREEWRRRLEAETAAAQARDDFEWLSGTGRFAQ